MHFFNLSLLSFLYVIIGLDVVGAKIASTGVFTGINSATGERPPRREISEMRSDIALFSLYIQALQAMQDTPESDQQSWFQIAGIHGRPYYAWDNVGGRAGAPAIGYCTHGDALFMAWHRPYLALYEQILARHVQRIAKQYNSPTWQRAADRFRIPYWDWAVAPYSMPGWFGSAKIRITRPSGPVDVNNPLNGYRFRRFPYGDNFFPRSDALSKYVRTLRRPNSNGVPDVNAINSLLTSQGPGIAQQLYTVFSRATRYNNMATQSSDGPSFEGPHGWVHLTVGGNGHMTDVGYAAFDPIFWLHHANVDRLGAMWQAIYPNSYLTETREPGGNWFIVPGQPINAGTYLYPFHQKDGRSPWTGTAARYPKTFGYSYPDVKDWTFTGSNAAARLSAAVTTRVNQLYNTRGRSSKRSIRGALVDRNAVPREWTVDISAPNAALGGASYALLLFIGEKPSNPAEWALKSVGSMYVLAQPMSPTSGPMMANTEVVITEFIQDAGIDTSNVNATRTFLDTQLSWGAQKFDGTVIPNDEFEGLKILIEDEVVKLPVDDTQLPKYSDKTIHNDITPEIPRRS